MHSHVNGLPFLTALPVVSWSCGAALRSVWWRPARRSLSPPEPSAITSCVTWPIGRRCTSRPRWSERRYSRASCTQINDLVPMSFTVDNKHLTVIHCLTHPTSLSKVAFGIFQCFTRIYSMMYQLNQWCSGAWRSEYVLIQPKMFPTACPVKERCPVL